MNNLMSSVIQFGVCVQECAHILMVFLDVIFEGCYQAGTLEHDDWSQFFKKFQVAVVLQEDGLLSLLNLLSTE